MTEMKQADNPDLQTTSEESSNDSSRSSPPAKRKVRSDGLIVWALISLGFLTFIAFGSVDARIWRFGNLRIESRSVLRVWTLQAENLPTVSQQWLLTALFYACIIAFVACALIGVWFLLDSAGTGLSRTVPPTDQDQDLA